MGSPRMTIKIFLLSREACVRSVEENQEGESSPLTTTTPPERSEDSSVSDVTSDSPGLLRTWIDSREQPIMFGAGPSGGKKEQKLARFDLLPALPLWQLAELYGRGAAKYAPNNWAKGYPWSLAVAAMMRHITLWMSGEDLDPETGCHHMTAVAFHAFSLLQFTETHPELDDRYRPVTSTNPEDIEAARAEAMKAIAGMRKDFAKEDVPPRPRRRGNVMRETQFGPTDMPIGNTD